jgi:hypothetical protein
MAGERGAGSSAAVQGADVSALGCRSCMEMHMPPCDSAGLAVGSSEPQSAAGPGAAYALSISVT